MDNRMTLFALTAQMAEIEDALYENGGELTPELETAMSETKESLAAKIDGYNALYQKLGAMAASAKAEMDRLGKIKKTAENGQKSLKDRLLYNMHLFGLEKMEGRLCKVSIRHSGSLKVDEELMLAPYRKQIDALSAAMPPYITLVPNISKTVIRDMYKGTDALPAGCEEVQNESLQIR